MGGVEVDDESIIGKRDQNIFRNDMGVKGLITAFIACLYPNQG